jgi:hypothetical protein
LFLSSDQPMMLSSNRRKAAPVNFAHAAQAVTAMVRIAARLVCNVETM